MTPASNEPIYKAEIRIFFEEELSKNKGFEYWNNFIKDLSSEIAGELSLFGTIQETHEFDVTKIGNKSCS